MRLLIYVERPENFEGIRVIVFQDVEGSMSVYDIFENSVYSQWSCRNFAIRIAHQFPNAEISERTKQRVNFGKARTLVTKLEKAFFQISRGIV